MLKDPNVRRLALAELISRTGGEAAFFVGIWGRAAFDFQATATQIAIMMGAIGVAALIGSTLAGVLIDRYDPKRVLIAGELAFLPGILALGKAPNMTWMAILAFVAWLPGSTVMTAVSSMPPFLASGPKDVERANVAIETAQTLAFVTGPIAGALIARYTDALFGVFVLDAVTSVIGVLIVMRITLRPAAPSSAGSDASFLREATAGFRYAWGHDSLRFLLALGGITFISFGIFTTLEPLFFREVLDSDAETLGWINAIFGAGVLAGTLWLSRVPGKFSNARALVMFTVLSGIGAVIYTATASLAVVAIGAIYWGAIIGIQMPLIRIVVQRHSEEHMMGRAMGALNVSAEIGELFPLLLAPALAAVFGVQAVLVGSGVLIALLAPLAFRRARRVDADELVSR